MTATMPGAGDGFTWDERLWREVWGRILTPVERHSLAMDVLHRRLPPTPFEARVALELARQWRRNARNLAIVYLLWTLFWSMLAWDTHQALGHASPLAVGCAVCGVVAIVVAWWFRVRLRGYVAVGVDASAVVAEADGDGRRGWPGPGVAAVDVREVVEDGDAEPGPR